MFHTLIQFVFVFLNMSVDLVPGDARLWKTRKLWGQCYISLGCRLVLVHYKYLSGLQLEGIHSRDYAVYFIGREESVYTRRELNSHRIIVTPYWYTSRQASLRVVGVGRPIQKGSNCCKVITWLLSYMFDLSVAPQNTVSNEDLQPHLILTARNGIVVNNSPRSTL